MPQTYTEYVPCAKHLLDPKETMNKTDFLVWRIRSLGRLTEKMILALGPEVIALDRQDKQDTISFLSFFLQKGFIYRPYKCFAGGSDGKESA